MPRVERGAWGAAHCPQMRRTVCARGIFAATMTGGGNEGATRRAKGATVAKADGAVLARKVIVLTGMVSLWMCLQASGFFPLSLIPSVGCFGVREVAGGHLAYSVALAGIAVAALVGSRWFKGSLNRAALCVVLGVCGVVGHGILLGPCCRWAGSNCWARC